MHDVDLTQKMHMNLYQILHLIWGILMRFSQNNRKVSLINMYENNSNQLTCFLKMVVLFTRTEIIPTNFK